MPAVFWLFCVFRHAGVYSQEEAALLLRDKLIRLQSLYIEQFKRLQHVLREKRRKFLQTYKQEREMLGKTPFFVPGLLSPWVMSVATNMWTATTDCNTTVIPGTESCSFVRLDWRQVVSGEVIAGTKTPGSWGELGITLNATLSSPKRFCSKMGSYVRHFNALWMVGGGGKVTRLCLETTCSKPFFACSLKCSRV